ncbi:MAG: DUF1349 domain-containing protein [Planctomycetales bacterium]|nr:DUF1349 domain-containing protein [Planctomycetales bacterium]
MLGSQFHMYFRRFHPRSTARKTRRVPFRPGMEVLEYRAVLSATGMHSDVYPVEMLPTAAEIRTFSNSVTDYTTVALGSLTVDNLRIAERTPSAITIAWDDFSEVAPPDQSVLNFFDANYPGWPNTFGANSTTEISLVSGPVPDQMNNGPQGQQWLAQGEGYEFKLTIEDGTGISIDSLVTELERLPEPYVRAYAEVSDPVGENGVSPEDGVAVYQDLAGAAGHGSRFYLNIHTNVVTFGWAGVTAHEAGHVLQQVADENDPAANYLARWQAAADADGRSVSPYGDSSNAEELAEFAAFYAVALDLELGPNETALDELYSLSPNRFALWEEILQYDSGTIPDGYRVETSTDDGATWTYLGDVAQDVTTWTENGLTPGTEHYYRVRPFYASGVGEWSVIMGATPATFLPAPWMSQDIGAVGGPGAAINTGDGEWTLIEGGSDIWDVSDSFHFLYQQFTGDGEIVAQVDAMENTHPFAKAGVMFRESLSASSTYVLAALTPTSGAEFSRRTAVGTFSDTNFQPGIAAPHWVRLVRLGDVFTAYVSADRVAWNEVGTANIPMTDTVYVGLAQTSHNTAQLNTSSFSNVAVNHATFRPVTIDPTANGFVASFNRPFDPTNLNLYDVGAGTFGMADVSLVGHFGGAIEGSLIVGVDSVTFVAAGGTLPADNYTVTIRSAADGFKDANGGLLDGNGDGNPGDDYVGEFAITDSGLRSFQLPGIVRGPGQIVDLEQSGGIPIKINDALGVTSFALTFHYDATLLSVSAATAGHDLPAGWQFQTDVNTPGEVRLSAEGVTPFPAGPAMLAVLTATVLAEAPRGATQELRLTDVSLNGGAIASQGTFGLHLVGNLGDSTGDGTYSGLDASMIARVAVGLDTGYGAFPLISPRTLGDVTGNGTVSALDASYIARKAVGLDQPQISALPVPMPLVSPPPSLSAAIDVMQDTSSNSNEQRIDALLAIWDWSVLASGRADDLVPTSNDARGGEASPSTRKSSWLTREENRFPSPKLVARSSSVKEPSHLIEDGLNGDIVNDAPEDELI